MGKYSPTNATSLITSTKSPTNMNIGNNGGSSSLSSITLHKRHSPLPNRSKTSNRLVVNETTAKVIPLTQKPNIFSKIMSNIYRINFFTILIFCGLSVFTNVIYFNYFYLSNLKNVNELISLRSRLEMSAFNDHIDSTRNLPSEQSYFGSLFALSSLIKFPRLSTSSESTPQAAAAAAKKKEDSNQFRFGISWDHVSFAHFDDDGSQKPDESANNYATIVAGLLDDPKSTTKKSKHN